MATILKLWCQIENPTLSIDAYLFEEHSCRISSRSDLKQRSFGIFEDSHPKKKKNRKTTATTRWVVTMRSVPANKNVSHFSQPPTKLFCFSFSFNSAEMCKKVYLSKTPNTTINYCKLKSIASGLPSVVVGHIDITAQLNQLFNDIASTIRDCVLYCSHRNLTRYVAFQYLTHDTVTCCHRAGYQ